MKRQLIICLISTAGIMAQSAQVVAETATQTVTQAEVYKWVDEQGRTHYGDKPVENAEQLELSVKPQSNSGSSQNSQSRHEKRKKLLDAIDEDNARERQEENKKREKQQQLKRYCIEAKTNLQKREQASYLYTLDKEGNRVVTSTEKRLEDSAELRKKIKKYCK